ncbi:MAG TPA: poly-gamma-glutamate biosynthesis protein PgsC [Vicinamibacterales bacterium]|nr:poly-gamma-glutamate biosynthesis protein PgsC [Vicinamibacterales bacterium]
MVELALGLGIAVSLIVSEAFGLASAGLVVPGYLALYLDQPPRLVATVVVALLTWASVRFGLARLVVLYGRRRFALTILTGFVLNIAFTRLTPMIPMETPELRAVGFIVPGLIANTALAQGPWVTLGVTFLVAAVVRLLLVWLAYV